MRKSLLIPVSLLVSVAVVPTGGAQNGEGLWRMYRGGPQRSGCGSGSGATGALRWHFDTNTQGYVTSPTAGAYGLLYVGSHDHNVYALDAQTGAAKWVFPTDEKVTAAPAVGPDGTVYVGSWDWRVYALDGATGAAKWECKTDGQVAASPAVADDGTVYVAGGGTLYALNGATGEPLWAASQDSILFGSPALSADGRRLYVALRYGDDHGLYALNATTGRTEWRFHTQFDEPSTPAVGPDGTVYFGSADDRVYALDGATGELRWEFITGRDAGSPALGPRGMVYIWTWDGILFAVSGATGEEVGQFRPEVEGRAWGEAAVAADGTVYLACEKVFALDESLHWLWEFGEDGNTLCSPTIGLDGTVYAGSDGGEVYALR